jgi:hypothetical protein
MRIAFVTTSHEWNGPARTFAAAARAFADAGDDVRFIVPPDSHVQERIAREPFVVEALDTGSWWLPRALRLSRSLSHHRADVVFIHTEAEHLAIALSSPVRGRRGIVRRTPSGQRLALGWRSRFAARVARTAFLFSSEKEAREALVPARLGPVFFAPLGVPAPNGGPEQGEEPPDPYHIICIYDGISRGRTALPVRTVALMAPRHPGIRLSMVGPGSDSEEIRMHVAALDILPRVDLLGEREDLPQLLRGASLGWIAGRSDDAGFAALDLMAAGLPAIAPEDPVCTQYVADGITGLIVRSEEATLAAGIIAGVIGSVDQVSAMSQAARARVAREFPETRMMEGFDHAAAAVRGSAAGERSAR